VTVRNGSGLEFREGSNGFRNCFSTTGVRATAANTDKVTIAAFNSTAAALPQITTIDESQGDFSSSNPKLAFFVLTGTGGDRLIVNETSSLDQVGVQDQTGGLALGPAVDLDMDGDIDIRMTTLNGIVQVNGNGFSDLLDASKLTIAQAVLVGGAGNDTLKGGARPDNLDGGADNDTIFAQDGNVENVIGGTGTNDTARLDFNDRPSGIEKEIF
jgi:Ca2+-binding RTX toxin-like protein